jgi:hypothetical protein
MKFGSNLKCYLLMIKILIGLEINKTREIFKWRDPNNRQFLVSAVNYY